MYSNSEHSSLTAAVQKTFACLGHIRALERLPSCSHVLIQISHPLVLDTQTALTSVIKFSFSTHGFPLQRSACIPSSLLDGLQKDILVQAGMHIWVLDMKARAGDKLVCLELQGNPAAVLEAAKRHLSWTPKDLPFTCLYGLPYATKASQCELGCGCRDGT